MLLTIAIILAATIALAAFELCAFWRLGERDQRRRIRARAETDAADAKERRTNSRLREEKHHTTGAAARLRGTIDFARRRAYD